jgi:hypothetical protein
MTISDTPGSGLTPLPPGPNIADAPLPGYWLCQFDVRLDLPSAMPTSNMEAWLAQVFAIGAVAAGLPANVQVALVATSNGSVANPTLPSSVAIPLPPVTSPGSGTVNSSPVPGGGGL